MNNKLKPLKISLLVILSLGAIYGGLMLIKDPSGNGFGWDIDILAGTPFRNFLIPGIILLLLNGIFPLLISVLIIFNKRLANLLLLLQGVILVFWLTAEIVFNRDLFSPVMHPLFYSIGLLLILMGIKSQTLQTRD